MTQRITEDPLKHCPTCNRDVHRIISTTSFVLKGNGWYATDYARKNRSESASSDSGASSSTTSSINGESKAASAKASSESSTSAEKSPAKPAD